MEALTSQPDGKQPQPQAQLPGDDWSFLDGALDWEALLDEPILETVMEDAALDMSPHALSGTTDSQRSQDTEVALAQLSADPQSQLQRNAMSGSVSPLTSEVPGVDTAAFTTSGGISNIPSVDITLPSMLVGLQAAAQSSGGFQSPLNGGLQPSGLQRPPGASSPEVVQQVATSSGDLRHTSSGDTSLRTSAFPSNSGDDAETPHKAHNHMQRHGSAKLQAARQAAATAREKNRAAQRRYRSRKKEQLQEVDERLAEMQRQLAQLQIDKEQLAQRNQLLERVASMHQQRQRAEADSAALNERAVTWWQDERLVDVMESKLQLQGPFVFTIKPDRPLFFTRKQVVNMPLKQFRDLYREYINATAACLLELATDPGSPALQRAERLIWEAGQMKCAIMVSLPTLMTSLHQLITGKTLDRTPAAAAVATIKLQHQQREPQLSQPEVAEPSDADWDQMVAGMRLTREQQDVILALRAAFLRSLGALMARRRRLVSTIQTAMPPGGADWELVTSTDAYGSATLGAFDALQKTLRDEHTVQMLYSLSVWRRVLSPLQMAHLNVTAFPHKPYITKLAEAVARMSDAPEQMELMATGARESTPLLGVDALDAMLPTSMRPWTVMPAVDLAALYPGVELPAEVVAAAGCGDNSDVAKSAGSQPVAAAASAAAGDVVAVKQEPSD